MVNDKICFVLMGYGKKTDLATGRPLNLDKTYENIIEPVFTELGIRCFRAIDYKHSGTIDVPMYEFIQKADIVIADISTLNANAIYELGVRHALRPRTTVVIAEKGLSYPFDLSHTVILGYEHLGADIGYTEVMRFRKELKELVQAIEADPRDDSPVYTYLKGLQPPSFTAQEIRELQAASEEADTVSGLLTTASRAMAVADYNQAKALLSAALALSPQESYIKQQLALATYKDEKPNALDALQKAEEYLTSLNPRRTTDTETLGLLGAVYKRRYQLTESEDDLSQAIDFYGRGFLLAKDYYNGINLSLLLLQQAVARTESIDALADIVLARRVRARTKSYCEELVANNFDERPDRVWIVLTLAEAAYANGDKEEFEKLLGQAEQLGEGKFQRESFNQQMALLEPVLRDTNALMEKWLS